MDVARFLAALGLERYAARFAEEAVDADLLPQLSDADLKEIGVAALGHRRKILAAVAELGLGSENPARAGPPQIGTAGAAQEGQGASSAVLPAGERRQVVILFADLSGFTKLSTELDPEDLHALLQRILERLDAIVTDYGGRVDKHIGDAVMAIFGAPLAHGNEPLRALRAACDMHRALADLSREEGRRLAIHVGIASGQVMAAGLGGKAHRDYTVVGDSVNLAARLMGMARDGETILSQQLREQLSDSAECDFLGKVEAKGFADPVAAWRFKALAEPGGARQTPFVGRRGEMAQFGALLQASKDGGGQVVLLRGEAGIGKTRLTQEMAREAGQQGFRLHRGLILDFGVGRGKDALRALLFSLLGIPADADEEACAQGCAAALAQGWVAQDEQIFLAVLLGMELAPAQRARFDAMDNRLRSAGEAALLTKLATSAARSSPLLFIVEDVHWADRPLLDHLAALARGLADAPAILVMTSRAEGNPIDNTWRQAAGQLPLTTIDLGPLRDTEASRIAESFLPPEQALEAGLIARAGGNPLFLEQLLRNLEGASPDQVPASIQSLVLSRIDRLAPEDKTTLQAASVLGQRFSLADLRALTANPAYDCQGLIARNLLRPEGEDYLFHHALIQEGVYASLLKSTAARLHARAAELLGERDPVLKAEHLARAGSPEAAQAFREAAHFLAENYRFEQALALARRGLELAQDAPERFALRCLVGDLQQDLGQVEEAVASYREAVAQAQDDWQKMRARKGLAAGYRLSNRYRDALAIIDEALPLAEKLGDRRELSSLHHLAGNLHFPLGNINPCRVSHEKALAYARESASREAETLALGGLGDAAYLAGRMLTAHDHFTRCVALAREIGLERAEVAHLPMAAVTLYYRDIPDAIPEATRLIQEARARASRAGHLWAEMNATACIAQPGLECGDFESNWQAGERTEELARLLGAKAWLSSVYLQRAIMLRQAGRRDEARRAVEAGLDNCWETTFGFFGPWLYSEFARLHDDPAEARKALSAGEAVIAAGCVGHNGIAFYRNALSVMLDQEDWAGVADWSRRFEAWMAAEPLPWCAGIIERARALSAFGQGRRDAALAEELQALHARFRRIGLRSALPRLERALAEF
jgi:class 3 adenylate cyclase/tetratricopeptide (TPR) repeat protein